MGGRQTRETQGRHSAPGGGGCAAKSAFPGKAQAPAAPASGPSSAGLARGTSAYPLPQRLGLDNVIHLARGDVSV